MTSALIIFESISMVYSAQNKAFFQNKKDFFSSNKSIELIDKQIESVHDQVKKTEYSFLLDNQHSIELEFNTMFTALNKLSGKDRKVFWLYCYYCASLMETFYQSYSRKADEEKYNGIKEQILARLNDTKSPSLTEESFIQSLSSSFVASLKKIVNAPVHAAQLRDYVANANLNRLYWVFCRLTMTQGLLFAQELNWIDKASVDGIISKFQAPSPVLNYLSVGFFLVRSLFDFSLLLKHTFFPSTQEELNTKWYERFKYEFYKRHCNFANDLVWATVNFLTNFNHITGIPGPAAGCITAAFLGFDVGLLLYRLMLARQEYLPKRLQLYKEIEECNASSLSQAEKDEHLEVLKMQIAILDINWKTKEAGFYFLAGAAALLMIGFTAGLVLSPPLFAAGCYFACLLGVAMYCSYGAFSKYKENSLYLDHAQRTGNKLQLAENEYETARNDFFFAMVKNTVVPAILITTFAVCWPAAVVLTAMYIGYEVFHGYNQHCDAVEAKHLALTA